MRNWIYLIAIAAFAVAIADLAKPGYGTYGNPLKQPMQQAWQRVKPELEKWRAENPIELKGRDAQCKGAPDGSWTISREQFEQLQRLQQKGELSVPQLLETLGNPLCEIDLKTWRYVPDFSDAALDIRIDGNGVHLKFERNTTEGLQPGLPAQRPGEALPSTTDL